MTTQLTNTGWFNGTTGIWSKRDDRVRDLRKGIELSSRFRPRTRAGDDLIDGAAVRRSGLTNAGSLKTEAGNDRVRGVSQAQAGILNKGTIDTGLENDRIRGVSTDSRGLVNQRSLYTSDGNDLITGRSISQEGIISGKFNYTAGDGIFMGKGNDTIRSTGPLAALRNDGFIDMGNGSDVVDVRRGGFAGTGYLYMGSGSDRVLGFGPQTINGGLGRDSLFLNKGRHEIIDITDEFGDPYGQKITDKRGTEMFVDGIERIGSALSLKEVDLNNGTLLINAMGDVSYL